MEKRIKELLDMSLYEIPRMVRDDEWDRGKWLKRWSKKIIKETK